MWAAHPTATSGSSATTPSAFDIHRKAERHVSFGYGAHFCLGANLARLEARVALEELLQKTPNWDVVADEARLVRGGPTRGYEYLPVIAHQ